MKSIGTGANPKSKDIVEECIEMNTSHPQPRDQHSDYSREEHWYWGQPEQGDYELEMIIFNEKVQKLPGPLRYGDVSHLSSQSTLATLKS